MPKTTPRFPIAGRPARPDQECPVVVDGEPCSSGQRIVLGVCLYHYTQRKQGRPFKKHSPRRRHGSSRARDAQGRKECSRCLKWKHLDAYSPSRTHPDGQQHWCRACSRDYMREKRYGLTNADVLRMLTAQGGCAICGSTHVPGEDSRNTWSVDHDHRCCPGESTCGKCVRAILCPPCNMLIGLAKEDPARLMAAARYCGKYQPPSKEKP